MNKIVKFFKSRFQRKPKPYLLDNTYRIVPAFQHRGETYYMHEDPLHVATGRGLTAMLFMEELLMRCSVDYLRYHTEACDKIFSDRSKIDLPTLMQLNNNLKERINLLVAMPEHIFKLASIVFFTKEESPYRYDQKFNEAKIKAWEKEPRMYDFFCQGHLKTLMPFLQSPEGNSEKYLEVVQAIHAKHMDNLHAVLSRKGSTTGLKR